MTELQCSHLASCPGCPRFGEFGVSKNKHRTLSELADTAGLDRVRVVEGERFHYRHRARLAVRGRSNSPKIGIFGEDSHHAVDIPNCVVHHPLINDVARAVKMVVKKYDLAPYADRPHKGLVRYLQIVVERKTQSAQLVIVTNDKSADAVRPAAEELERFLGKSLNAIFWNGQPERSNTILGNYWNKLSGRDTVTESMGGVEAVYPPGAFGQSNLDLAEKIVEKVHSLVPAGARVFEFHCGVGAIGLGLLKKSQSVVFNEISAHGIEGLEAGLALLPDEERSRAVVKRGSAADYVRLIESHDIVIADPPRRGMEPELFARLHDRPPQRFIMVACGFDSFVRDAMRLIETRRWRLTDLSAYALFPHTDHVEIAACFDRT